MQTDAKLERRAAARIGSQADVGAQIQRTISMTEGLLDLLEAEYIEFRGKGWAAVPKGFETRLGNVASLLQDLTLSYARYQKSEEEWQSRLTPEEKLDATADFALKLFKERPDRVTKWLQQLINRINRAGDTTKIEAAELRGRVTHRSLSVDKAIEAVQTHVEYGWPDK